MPVTGDHWETHLSFPPDPPNPTELLDSYLGATPSVFPHLPELKIWYLYLFHFW